MSLRKIGFIILSAVLGFLSCNNDDDGNTIPEVVIRDRAEQQMADNDSIIKYLTSHYYNAGDFEGNTNIKVSDLIIEEVPENGVLPNATDRVLYTDDGDDTNDAVQVKTTTFADTEYTYYILQLNKGEGKTPNFSDRVRVVYEGFLLNEFVFDGVVTPIDLDLVGNGADITGTIVGWKKVFPQFKASQSFVENEDGTVAFNNHGSGVMFLPSGLAYFANARPGIPAYTPLVFKFDLLQTFETDYDLDGVPSHLEKFVTTGEFGDQFFASTDEDEPDDDTDGDGIPDFVDVDDDGDGVLTINEDLEDMDLTVDSDGDGDPTNDRDGDGDPTNDDTDGDGIPNYLDPDDAISKEG